MLLYEQECLSLSYWWNIMMALVRWCKEVPQVVIKLTCFEYVVMFMEKTQFVKNVECVLVFIYVIVKKQKLAINEKHCAGVHI